MVSIAGTSCSHKRCTTRRASADCKARPLTFEDMPICFFRPDICPKLLSLADEKITAFAEQTPLDHLFIVPFTRELGATPAREFLARWVEMAGLKLFIGGPDFALGRGREGTIAQIAELGRELGFEAHGLEGKLLEEGTPISSTRSRGIIEAGQVELSRAFFRATLPHGGRGRLRRPDRTYHRGARPSIWGFTSANALLKTAFTPCARASMMVLNGTRRSISECARRWED